MADKCLCHAYFEGVYDKQIKQGQDFDLAQGVRAIDGYGNEVDFTYEPTEIDLCKTGDQEVTYKAFGASFNVVPKLCMPKYKRGVSIPEACSSDLEMITAKRIIRIIRASNPRFLGITRVFINENDAFDPTEGVTAVDDNGNPITDITYSGTLDKEVSGDIASIDDGDERYPVKSLKAQIEPIQSGSGTPSPDNVRPISGRTVVNTQRTGVNVWDEEWEKGVISSNGQPTGDNNNIRSKNFIPVTPQTQYYIKVPTANASTPFTVIIYGYDAETNFVKRIKYSSGNAVFTTSDNGIRYIKFCTVATDGVSYGGTYKNDISINYPSTDTDYHAYNGNTYTTTLGRTVYGGTLDVVSGELVVDRAMVVLDGTEAWGKDGDLRGYHRFYVENNDIKKQTNYIGHIVTNACEVVNTYAYFAGFSGEMAVTAYSIMTNLFNYLYLISQSLSSVADVKAYLASNPLQVVYELATPQTYQLDPQTISLLHGNNNVWSDGEVEMVYSVELPTDGEVSYPLEGEYEITYSASDKCGNIGEAIRHITVQ